MTEIKHDWEKEEILNIHNLPLLDLIFQSATVHRKYHNPQEIQVSSLISIKTGGCSENCGYCSQSAHHETEVKVHKILPLEEVKELAEIARKGGASRMCLGAAWREVRNNSDFDKVLEMVRAINGKGMQVCCTLGMLTEEQAQKLAEAGLYAYNHNLDTSEEFYPEIVNTRTYQDRIDTLSKVRRAGITLCSGGIIGMGESIDDRISLLKSLSSMNPHPESVPINALIPIKGTPLGDKIISSTNGKGLVPIWDMVRMVATARILMPTSAVRLSAGRINFSKEGQALCFFAGANSIFAGDKLLTAPNPELNEDLELFSILGLKPTQTTQNVKAGS